jgi:hypothetical protein
MSRVNIVNITDYYIGFNTYSKEENAALCSIEPGEGILQPRSTQKLVVKREANVKELGDLPCKDSYLVWTSIVTESVEASNIIDYKITEESKELPIVFQKASSLIMYHDQFKNLFLTESAKRNSKKTH